MTDLSLYLSRERVLLLRSRKKEGAIRELVASVCRTVPGMERRTLLEAIWERERTVSSWISPGIAIPHARLPDLEGFIVAVGRSWKGISYDSSDGSLVNLLILILGDEREHDRYILLLAEIARMLHEQALRQRILSARTREGIYRVLTRQEEGRGKGAGMAKRRLSRLFFDHALAVADKVGAKAIMLHADALGNVGFIRTPQERRRVILITLDQGAYREQAESFQHVLQLPFSGLKRSDQVDLSLLFAVSRGLFHRGDLVVSLGGEAESGILDTLMLIDVGREFPAFFPAFASNPLGDVRPEILERVLRIATDLSREGREGSHVGTIFVIGDYERVRESCRQMVINPFRGYQDEERNILDPSLEETVKEFSTIDGAFVLRGDGVLMSAGTFLKPDKSPVSLPPGLGSRHLAAAAITVRTGAISVAISQSTGAVRLFKAGKVSLTVERPRS